jgi:hypothetical protein
MREVTKVERYFGVGDGGQISSIRLKLTGTRVDLLDVQAVRVTVRQIGSALGKPLITYPPANGLDKRLNHENTSTMIRCKFWENVGERKVRRGKAAAAR